MRHSEEIGFSRKNAIKGFKSIGKGLATQMSRWYFDYRQSKNYSKGIIHPLKTFRTFWDFSVSTILLYQVFSIPMCITFMENMHSFCLISNSACDSIFLLDIGLNFNTGYIDRNKRTIVMKRKSIVVEYLTSWFCLDLISSLPFDYFYLIFTNLPEFVKASRALRLLKIFRILCLLKILRISRLFRCLARIAECLGVSDCELRVFKVILMMLAVCHWNACVQYLLPMITGKLASGNFGILGHQITNETIFEKYTWSLFAAVSQISSAGYGRGRQCVDTMEAWLVTFSMAIGGTFLAMLSSNLAALLSHIHSADQMYEHKMHSVREFMLHKGIPIDVRCRIIEYFATCYKRSLHNEQSIVVELPKSLKQKILCHNVGKILKSVPCLYDCPDNIIAEIAIRLSFDIYMPDQEIKIKGSSNNSLLFIKAGCVTAKMGSTSMVVTTLTIGEYFGVGLFKNSGHGHEGLRYYANEATELYVLTSEALNELKNIHSYINKMIDNLCASRSQI